MPNSDESTQPKHPAQPASVSRRSALKVGAAAGALVGVAATLSGCGNNDKGEPAPTIVDSNSATSILEKYKTDDVTSPLVEGSSFPMPLGTVLHEAPGAWHPYLTPDTGAGSMVSAGALSISSGTAVTVVSKPVTPGTGWVIFDVRCSDSAYAWVELDIVTHDWKLLASGFSQGALSSTPSTLWEGTSDYDPPMLAVSDTRVFWLVMPSTSGKKTTESSGCYVWHVGATTSDRVVESQGRFACAPAISGKTLTLAPRVRVKEGVFYGLTAYSLDGDLTEQVDQLVMPVSVRPFQAVYMGDKFAFSVEANYGSGGLLGNMGTYIGSSSTLSFVTLSREPAAAVCGRGDVFIIKSRASYFVVDISKEEYSLLYAQDRSLDYGEYPACNGTCDTFVTYCTVKDQNSGYPSQVVVRTFSF